MKTYSGKYTVKNRQKYEGDPDGVVYRSMWEKYAFKWCDENPRIVKWSSEEVCIPYYYEIDKMYHRYFVDLKIVSETGETLLVEIKPEKQTKAPQSKRKTKQYIQEGFAYVKNINKWESADKYAKKLGWKFVIWTEKNLTEMGIMPKSSQKPPGKLKPMKRYKKSKKLI